MEERRVILNVEDLRVSFFTKAGEVQAVRGESWYLREKETVAIVGESGCGKTVSIQTVMGLLQKPIGRIKSGRITDCTIEKLTSGKKYYVRMRSFKKVGSKNSYSEWSAVKERTIK